jgi:hypothetical protein
MGRTSSFRGPAIKPINVSQVVHALRRLVGAPLVQSLPLLSAAAPLQRRAASMRQGRFFLEEEAKLRTLFDA